MNLKLQKIIQKLEKKFPRKIDLTLERQFKILKKLGNPQDKLKNVISVVGTNSKFSIIQALFSILKEANFKCNLFLSPHLQSYTERFIFDNHEINEESLVNLLQDIEKIIGDDECTLFEALTCAHLKFAENYPDNISIYEAGMFHFADSTNIFKKNVANILGTFSLDHVQWLKNKTIDGVIYEKTARLLNSNIFVNRQENNEIFKKVEKALINNKSEKYFFGRDFNILRAENNFINYQDQFGEIILPEPRVLGDHQLWNISTSIAASRKLFNVKDEHIKAAVIKLELKGRLEEIHSGKLKDLVGKNRLVIDGGHNIGAGLAIANWIKSQEEDVHLICGMMKDKPHKEFINLFKDIVKSITLIDIPNQIGSITKEEFKNKLNGINKKINLSNSIEESIKSISEYQNTIALCVGSLYLSGKILNLN